MTTHAHRRPPMPTWVDFETYQAVTPLLDEAAQIQDAGH